MILEKFAFFGHFSVSYESKVLKIKNESTPFFAIASRFVTFFWYGHAKKSYPISLDFSAFVSLFLFLLCLSFCCVANCQLTANCQSVQEFSRKHHPKGKFLCLHCYLVHLSINLILKYVLISPRLDKLISYLRGESNVTSYIFNKFVVVVVVNSYQVMKREIFPPFSNL